MKPDIKRLTKALSEKIQSEAHIVYILVELRKLLHLKAYEDEENGLPVDSSFYALEFYCDWAVHPFLDQIGAERIARRFDRYQGIMDRTTKDENGVPVLSDEEYQLFDELADTVQLTKFKGQLSQFLTLNDLPDPITVDKASWKNFLSYYFPVIEDCPLICRAELNYVREISITVIDLRPPSARGSSEFMLMIAWEWKRHDEPIRMRQVSFF